MKIALMKTAKYSLKLTLNKFSIPKLKKAKV